MATATQTIKPNRSRRTLVVVAGLAALAIVAAVAFMLAQAGSHTAAVSAPPASGSAKPATGPFKVGLAEFGVTGIPATIAAGQVTFNMTNTGSVEHEMLVFKSDLAAAKYPVDANGRITEEGAGVTKVSDGENIAAGQSQSRTIDLSSPGQYMFVCNLPGHFGSGMFTIVTVK